MANYLKNDPFLKGYTQKSPILLGYFGQQICQHELSKIAQSGHTDHNLRAIEQHDKSVLWIDSGIPKNLGYNRCRDFYFFLIFVKRYFVEDNIGLNKD